MDIHEATRKLEDAGLRIVVTDSIQGDIRLRGGSRIIASAPDLPADLADPFIIHFYQFLVVAVLLGPGQHASVIYLGDSLEKAITSLMNYFEFKARHLDTDVLNNVFRLNSVGFVPEFIDSLCVQAHFLGPQYIGYTSHFNDEVVSLYERQSGKFSFVCWNNGIWNVSTVTNDQTLSSMSFKSFDDATKSITEPT